VRLKFNFFKRLNTKVMFSLLSVIGIVLIIEGVPYFCFPEKVREFSEKIQELQPSALRTLGFILMVVGLGVVFISEKVL